MSNTATVTFTIDGSAGNLNDVFVNSNPNLAMSYIQNYVGALVSGNSAASLNVKINTGNSVAASGTVTVIAPILGDKLLINGVAFSAGTSFAIGGTDAITATNLKDAVNASTNPLIAGMVTADSSGHTVTITSVSFGASGNTITLEGQGTGAIDPVGSGVSASGTLSIASVAASNTASVNGTTVTAVDKREKSQVTCIADTGAFEISDITTVAELGAFESETITTVPDVADSLNSKYFTFSAMNSGGGSSTAYYVWYSTGTGVDPTPGGTGIPVVITTGASDVDVATATGSAVTSVAGSLVVVSGATNQVIITNKFMGNATNAADGTAATGFAFSDVSGVASNLNSTYFTFSALNTLGAPSDYYVWYNINGEGVDPALVGPTPIMVTGASLASANTLATATQAAITSAAGSLLTVSGGTNHVILTGKFVGNATDAADGVAPTGFGFAITPGAASNLNNSFFTFKSAADATSYFMWYNVNGQGVAPTPGGTGIAVAVAAGDIANTVAANSRAKFILTPLITDFIESGATDKILFQVKSTGVTTDTADGTAATGFAFSTTIQGAALAPTEFQIDASDTVSATNLKTTLNAQVALSSLIVATSALGVVTVTAREEGVEGNTITLTATGNITANGARLSGGTASAQIRLSGGTNDSSATTYNFGR